MNSSVQSKDTDITGVLVGVIVVAMGVLIAVGTQQFINQSTSTSSRASAKKSGLASSKYAVNSGTTLEESCYLELNKITGNKYLGSDFQKAVTFVKDTAFAPTFKNFCGVSVSFYNGYVGRNTDKITTPMNFGSCCLSVKVMYDKNDKDCAFINGDGNVTNHRCKNTGSKCDTTIYGNDLKGEYKYFPSFRMTCDVVTGSGANYTFNKGTGTCCSNIAPTITPTPKR